MRDSLEPHWHEPPMNRIREIREAAGLSSTELAELVGTSSSQILRLETGERRLTVEWMQKIAQALRVTPTDLISNTGLAEITEDEVEPVAPDAVSLAIADKGLKIYMAAHIPARRQMALAAIATTGKSGALNGRAGFPIKTKQTTKPTPTRGTGSP